MTNNIFINNKTKILKERSFIILAATLIISGFFVANFALAEHTATVTVDPTVVKGGATDTTYTFTVTNNGDDISAIYIYHDSVFTNVNITQCPTNWLSSYRADLNRGSCTCDLSDPDAVCSAVNVATVKFLATAPSPDINTSYDWTIKTMDTNGVYDTDGDDIVQTTVDVTPPIIDSIITKDTTGDGNIETATIVFSEPIDDSTFSASNFTIGGQTAGSIVTGTENDNTFDITLIEGVEGTNAKDVTYMQGEGVDLVGNLLANVGSGDVIETDGANPIFLYVKTTSVNTIELTFSEILDGTTVSKDDFGVDTNTSANNVDLANTNGNVVILNLVSPIAPDATPIVYYDNTWSEGVKDPSNNTAPTKDVVANDGITPTLDSAILKTSTTVELTFSENIVFYTSEEDTNGKITLKGQNPTGIVIVDNMATLTFSESLGTAAITADLQIAADAFKDLAENVLSVIENQDVADEAKPLVESATANPDPAKAGDVVMTVLFSEIMDTIAPTLGFTGITGDITSKSDGVWSVGDNTTWTETFTLSDENEEKIAIISVVGAKDSLNNIMVDNTSAGTFDVDTVEPTVVLGSGTANPTNSLIAVTAEFSEVVTGFESDDVTVSNGAVEDFVAVDGDTYTFDVNPTDGASVAVTINVLDNKAVDAAGNNNTASNQLTYTSDTVAPTVEITSPLTEEKVNGDKVITFTDDELTSPLCSINETDWISCTRETTKLSDITGFNGLEQGVFTLYLKDTDAAGNTGTDSEADIIKDTISPTVNITYNPTSPVKAGSVEITATYSEAIVGTPNISIVQQGTEEISNVDMTNSGDQTIWTYTYTVHFATGGTYIDGEVTVSLSVVVDAAGNDAEAPGEGTTFVIDTTPPTSLITSPTTDDVIKSSDVSLVYSASDANSITCYYKVDEGAETLITNCVSPITISSLGDGRRAITLIVKDAAGNETTDDISIVIDLDITLIVDDTLENNPDFATIQAAINAATAGDTIEVAAGTYDEQITITKQLTLDGGDVATLQPTSVLYQGEYDVQIYASGVIVQNFIFDFDGTEGDRGGLNRTGIVIGEDGEPYPTVENVQVLNNIIYSAAVAIQSGREIDVDGLVISGNVIHLDMDGDGNLSAWDVAGIYINPNAGDSTTTVSGNSIDGHIGYGIAVETSDVTVSGNTVDNTVDTGDKAGIRYIDWANDNHTGVIIYNNTVNNMPKGVWVRSGAGFGSFAGAIQLNTLTNNNIGIWLSTGVTVDLVVNNNDIDGNTVGLQNESGVSIDAKYNWWGCVEGPENASCDSVSANVDYNPWLEDTKDAAPVRNNGQPVDYTNIADPTLSLETDRNATCKYSQTAGTDYGSIIDVFITTGETYHSVDLSGLTEGSYTYYVRCKSGLADEPVNSDDYEILFTVDLTAPGITSRTPGINAVGVDANTDITVVFKEDVACSDEWSACITLSDGGSISGSADYDSNTKTLIFNPDSPLESNTEFTATLTGITDLGGNSLTGTTGWSFTTATYYSINIYNGWNLISVPTVPINTSISEVLGEAANNIESVWMYDAVDNEWYVYHPDGSPGYLNTMTTGYGYWINATADTAIDGYGSLYAEQQTPPQRQLTSGWNLVGYYQNAGDENVPANYALATLSDDYTDATRKYWTSLVGYDNTNKSFNSVEWNGTVYPNDGFWIFMKSSTITYMYGPGESE
ncbi:MAG: Ig-like domain-containing protein [Candidatus Nealsonbacteria bacterium]